MGWRERLATLAARRNRLLPDRPAPPSSRDLGAIHIPASTLEDLSALLLKAAASDVEIEELCSCAMRLAQATGCALVEWDELAEESQIHGSVGAWEEAPVHTALERTVPDWAFALGGAPICVSRDGGTVRAFHWSASASAASGLAIPMRLGDRVCGALLFTYLGPRVFSPEEVRIGRLIACHAALVVRHRALATTVERQAQRIARLVDDVERMQISLRRVSARTEGEAKP